MLDCDLINESEVSMIGKKYTLYIVCLYTAGWQNRNWVMLNEV